jgi:hypothetical protein
LQLGSKTLIDVKTFHDKREFKETNHKPMKNHSKKKWKKRKRKKAVDILYDCQPIDFIINFNFVDAANQQLHF